MRLSRFNKHLPHLDDIITFAFKSLFHIIKPISLEPRLFMAFEAKNGCEFFFTSIEGCCESGVATRCMLILRFQKRHHKSVLVNPSICWIDKNISVGDSNVQQRTATTYDNLLAISLKRKSFITPASPVRLHNFAACASGGEV